MRFGKVLVFGLTLITLTACATIQPEPTANLSPTETPVPPTATLTATPEETSTSEPATPTPYPISIRPEVIVQTTFNDAQTATWALFVKLNLENSPSALLGTTLVIHINDVIFTFSGEEIIEQIEKYKGVLVDYDESDFNDNETLEVEIKVVSSDGTFIGYSLDELANWDVIGAIKLPVDINEKTQDGLPRFIVYHLDDIDPTLALLSSFRAFQEKSYTSGSRWIGGVEPNHGNAIDIGYYYILDPTRTIIRAPEDIVLKKTICNPEPQNTEMTTCNYFFELPISVIVLDFNGEQLMSCQLEIEWAHLTVSPQDLQNYSSVYNSNRRNIISGTPLGVMELRGRANAEIHIGVYCPKCVGGNSCDPYWASNDPKSLILPVSMFFSPLDNELIFESMKNTR